MIVRALHAVLLLSRAERLEVTASVVSVCMSPSFHVLLFLTFSCVGQ
jgi:hypothetical protein